MQQITAIWSWLMSNGVGMLIALIAFDEAMERVFPNATILQRIGNALKSVVNFFIGLGAKSS